MKTNIQIKVVEFPSKYSINGPKNLKNEETFRNLKGFYETRDNRCLLDNNEENRSKIQEIFGNPSPSVVVSLGINDLTEYKNQLSIGGYLIASYDSSLKAISMPSGVELTNGSWDTDQTVKYDRICISVTNPEFHVVVRRHFAESRGLEIIAEIMKKEPVNTLANYSKAELKCALEQRGYQVTSRRQF